MSARIVIEGGEGFDRQFHERGNALNKTYASAVTAAGGVPYLVTEPEEAADYAEFGDALIMTGSFAFSPDPALLQELLKKNDGIRDKFSKSLFSEFVKRRKPVYGICLGFQTINVALGGTLKKDFKLEDGVEHMLNPHTIRVEKDSLLGKLYGENMIVNSRHNWRVEELADSLRPTAWSEDGVIEAFEHRTLPVFGFEWHPERMRGDYRDPYNAPDTTPLFEALVRLAEGQKEWIQQ